MSAAEIRVRCRQAVHKRADALRYYLGLPEKPRLSASSPSSARFFFDEADVPIILSELQRHSPKQIASILRQADRVCEHRFDLLGYEGLELGLKLDWHGDVVHGKRAPLKPWHRVHFLDFQEVGDSKVTWELNRHQHLITLAKAYRISGDEKYSRELFEQWYDWQEQNPYPAGINWASSLEVGFRSLSWLWAWHLLAGTPVVAPGFRQDLLTALAIAAGHIERYLSTYFSANTHLLGEGVALFFIGMLCPEIEAAGRWRRLGWQIVLQQAKEQVRADGMHFEQSTHYHVYALDFFLHAYILARRNEQVIPEFFTATIERMLEALRCLTQSGAPPRFGDDDGGRLFDPRRNRAEHLTDPLATGAVLLHRFDWKVRQGGIPEESLWLLGSTAVEEYNSLPFSPTTGMTSKALGDSGYYVMADRQLAAQLTIDGGPQGEKSAGHAHADALSLQLSVGGQEFLGDPGTFEYVGRGPERDIFRCTGSHSTLQVDGCSQSQPLGPFSWHTLPKAHAEQWVAAPGFDLFLGSHDGYSRLQRPVTHQRWVFHVKSSFWLVNDVVLGAGEHDLEQIWRVATENLSCQQNLLTLRSGRQAVTIVCAEEHGACSITHEPWSPVYGACVTRPVLHVRQKSTLPAEIATLLLPCGPEQAGRFERVAGAAEARAYRYTRAEETHYFAFGPRSGACDVFSWSSDADFLYFAADAAGSLRHVISLNSSYLKINEQVLIPRREPLQWAEIRMQPAAIQIMTSEDHSSSGAVQRVEESSLVREGD